MADVKPFRYDPHTDQWYPSPGYRYRRFYTKRTGPSAALSTIMNSEGIGYAE